MKIHYERGCTDEISSIKVDHIVRTKTEFILVGEITDAVIPFEPKPGYKMVLGVLQDIENEEVFYIYETFMNLDKHKKEPISRKLKYFLGDTDVVYSWVHVPKLDFVLIPSGRKANSCDAFPCLPGDNVEMMLYDKITDRVVKADL